MGRLSRSQPVTGAGGFPEMAHPAHTSASTDPDRTPAPDRSDPAPNCTDATDCTDATPRPDRTGEIPTGPDDRDRQTFPAEGYEGRAYRARAEPMAVWPLRDGRYLVDVENRTYVVNAERAACTCPDSAIRGARCKHVRRVAIEIDAGLVPAPDERERPCAVCGGSAFVADDARGPALCSRHDHDIGSLVADRETGKRLVVVAATGRRADDVRTDEGRLVADYDTNAAYGRHEPVFGARYVRTTEDYGLTVTGRRYLFPASRLRRVDTDSTATDRPTGPTSERRAPPVRVG
jgi:hypothetical protein